MKYILEVFRSAIEFDEFVEFKKLSSAKKAMAEICQSEGKTLAVIRKPGSEGEVVAVRDWYADEAYYGSVDRETYEELIDVLEAKRNPFEAAQNIAA